MIITGWEYIFCDGNEIKIVSFKGTMCFKVQAGKVIIQGETAILER